MVQLNYNYISKQINYRWIYGLILAFLVFSNRGSFAVTQLTDVQLKIGLTILFAQYFIFNGLFSAWLSAKRWNKLIFSLGIFLDLLLISVINFVMGGNNFSYVMLYLIPLIFTANNRLAHNVTYLLAAFSYTALEVSVNANNFFDREIFLKYFFNLSCLSFFVLVIKQVIRNTISETKQKMQGIIYDIRNSLSVILGYITVLSNETVTPTEQQQYYDAMELATLKIRNLCDQFSSLKSNIPLKIIPKPKTPEVLDPVQITEAEVLADRTAENR